MNPHDHEIDKILAALNHTQPTPGLETRILHRLDQHREPGPASPWIMRMAWAGGFAIASVAIAFTLHHSHRHIAAHDIAAHAHAPVAVTSLHNATLASGRIAEAQKQPHLQHVQAERPLRQTTQTAPAAETDATAVSFPAPPMPLTDQEKLLLRIAHRGEQKPITPPPSLALGMEIAELRADTDRFFQDPTTGENQWKQIVAEQSATK